MSLKLMAHMASVRSSRSTTDPEMLTAALVLLGRTGRRWPHMIAERQRQDATLRSANVQREVLNIELSDLQQSLMRAWHLPELRVQINDERQAEATQVRNVLLAVRLARHTARGWDNAALDDDVRDIAQLLNLGPTPTLQLLHDIDA